MRLKSLFCFVASALVISIACIASANSRATSSAPRMPSSRSMVSTRRLENSG